MNPVGIVIAVLTFVVSALLIYRTIQRFEKETEKSLNTFFNTLIVVVLISIGLRNDD
jgi:prolipoprotein diacylglyceryltransferase